MTDVPDGLAWQPSLFSTGADPGGPDLSFAALVRYRLDDRSWVDVVPGWLHAHDKLFELLRRDGDWRQRSRRLYDRTVDEPRLVTAWTVPGLAAETAGSGRVGEDPGNAVPPRPMPAEVDRLRVALGERYRVDLDAVLVNLYRDGRDSVAWHRDSVHRRLRNPLVATVSLGARRRFLLRPLGGPVALRLEPGEGDLVVMGGACQHEWEHTVPKEGVRERRGARMSITLRHSRPGRDQAAGGP